MNSSLDAPMLWKWQFWAGVLVLCVVTFYIKGYIDHAGAEVLLRGEGIYAPNNYTPER